MDGISPVNPTSTADADVPEAKAAVSKSTVAAAKEEAPKARDDPPDSQLFFSGLLKTHRSMEREARAAKISSLRIT